MEPDFVGLMQALLKKIVFLIPAIIIIALMFITLRFVYTKLGIQAALGNQAKSLGEKDFLPPPGSLGIAGGKAPTPSDKTTNPSMEELNPWLYHNGDTRVTPSVYSQYQGTYSYYDKTTIYTAANPEMRNITIVGAQYVGSGATLAGEARSTFMRSGKFLITLINGNGQTVMSTVGYAQPNPNKNMFIPWKAQAGYVPPGSAPCTLVLASEVYSGDKTGSRVIRIPVSCK